MHRPSFAVRGCLLYMALSMGQAVRAAGLPDVASYGERIVVQHDLSFPASDERQQKLDLYRPRGVGPFAVVVCWHGGNFVGGSKADMSRICALLADRGLAAVAANYHLAKADSPGFPNNVNDAKSAVRFLRRRAGEYQLDPERIAVLGHSAGAYLALMVGFTPQHEKFPGAGPLRETSDRVAAVVNIAGVCDRRAGLGKGTANLLGPGYETDLELRTLASPVVHIRPTCPPVYTLQGLDDDIVRPDSARQLDAVLQSAGAAHRLELIPKVGHNPISVETMRPIADWLRRQLKAM